MTLALELALVGFVLACAVAVALLRDVLGAIIAFSAYSLGISVIWVFLRAPDVGLTEAAVGVGVMTILLLLTVAKTVRPATERIIDRFDLPAFVVALALVLALAATLPALPPVGDPGSPVATSEVTDYYLENTYAETGVENVVTAVLVAYRGFDTLGEATVVFTAGVGLLVVFHKGVFK